MDAGYVAALSGLIGAAIGSASSIATMIIQAKTKDRRDRAKQVTDMALAEFKMALELAVTGRGPPNVMPLSTYIHHNDLVLRALEDDALSPKTVRDIAAKAEAMRAVVMELEKVKS
jgi:hypothetical protein